MIILQVLYFLLPEYLANMAPCFVSRCCKWLAVPIDQGVKVNGKALFGKNKTWRGIIFGILFALGMGFIQYLVFKNNIWPRLQLVDYSQWFTVSVLLGLGALVGDLVESFIKRQLNLKPGSLFIPFDQIDHVVGALLFVSLVVKLNFSIWIIAIGATFFLHVITNQISYLLGFRKTRW